MPPFASSYAQRSARVRSAICKCRFHVRHPARQQNRCRSVNKIIQLKERLRNAGICFGNVFPTVLTDNGGDFGNVLHLKTILTGRRKSLYSSAIQTSHEKPHMENNHIIFRDIVPKGTSFGDFTQETVNMIFSHVNGVARKQFNGKSAYDIFIFAYSAALTTALGISFIPPKEVIQSPELLKLLQNKSP